jgi:acyl-coenzyme A thioesterase PaaI-like protein
MIPLRYFIELVVRGNIVFLSTMRKLEREYHPRCWFSEKMDDVPVSFDEEGRLTAVFSCDAKYRGYEGIIHGGVISALFDWAMTHCLFGHGIKAYTARLNVRYSLPVETGAEATINVTPGEVVRANIRRIRATIVQKKRLRASAIALFWEDPDMHGTEGRLENIP